MNAKRTVRHPVIETINRLLADRGINKSDFARRLGWGRMQVHRRMAGDVDLTVAEMEQIATALDVPVADLIAGKRAA